MSETTTGLFCPICGSNWQKIPVSESGIVLEQKYHCHYCGNDYIILITQNHELMITAKLVE